MKDIERLLRDSQHTIRNLREQNRVLSAQVFVIEAFHAALLGVPRGEGMSPDICWEIERYLESQKAESQSALGEQAT